MRKERSDKGKPRSQMSMFYAGQPVRAITGQARMDPIRHRSDAIVERNDWMVAQYMAGLTLQQIGDQHGVTRERVRQIIARRFPVKAMRRGRSRFHKRQAKTEGLIQHQCCVCWDMFYSGSKRKAHARLPTCGKRCHDLMLKARHLVEGGKYYLKQARYWLAHPEKSKPTWVRWAKKVLAGVPTRGAYNKPNPDNKTGLAWKVIQQMRQGKVWLGTDTNEASTEERDRVDI